MKRSGYILRKTRLRSGSRLKRGKKLRPVSKKRAREMKAYSLLRDAFILANPVCQICGIAPSTELHHRAGRGAHYLNPDYFSALCSRCHRAVHDRPSEARKTGWLVTAEAPRPFPSHD